MFYELLEHHILVITRFTNMYKRLHVTLLLRLHRYFCLVCRTTQLHPTKKYHLCLHMLFFYCTATYQRWAWTGLDILQDTCDFFRIRIGFAYTFLKKIGSGQDQDIGLIFITKFSWEWFKMSQTMFSLLWFLHCQYVLHSSHSVIIRVTLSLIFSGQVEVVSCSYVAVCCFVCCAEWHMCVLCRLIIVYFMGGQHVFVWDRLGLEDFLITCDRPASNKFTNTISYAKVEYHMCKYRAPLSLIHRQKAKCLLRLNHDCHAIIWEASLWSATTIGTKEYTWPTNWWILFMDFLEYWLKNVLFRYLVNPMQNEARLTKWHSGISRSMRSTYWPPWSISAFKATFLG